MQPPSKKPKSITNCCEYRYIRLHLKEKLSKEKSKCDVQKVYKIY